MAGTQRNIAETHVAFGLGPEMPSIHPNYARIYSVVRRVPKGRVATYGQIAVLAGMPRHARQVGYALNKLPEGERVPWHRIINSQGRVSARSRPGSDDFQRILLEDEGIGFDISGRVPLAKYGWKPRLHPLRTSRKSKKK